MMHAVDDLANGDPSLGSALKTYSDSVSRQRQSLFWQRTVKYIENIFFGAGRQYHDDLLVSRVSQNNAGDLWDSAKVASDQSVNFDYAGKELVSEQECFWKLQVWDQDGQALGWSAPARWTMGLLKPTGAKRQWILDRTKADWTPASAWLKPVAWKAQWIGFDGEAASDDAQAKQLKSLLTFTGSQWFWVVLSNYHAKLKY